MMSKKSPQLRFEGFTDDWEQRKLGELSQKISVGIATSSSKYFSSQDHGVPFIKNQDIKENRINTKNLEYISKEFDNKNKNKRVKQGDIITARTGYPGLSAVVPKELEGAQTFTTLITRPISEMILSEYISIFINSPYGMKQISGMEAGGAQKNVNAGIVQNLLIPLPSLDEQKKISNFILKLDDTIALHQRKLDLLKEQKKGYLQKMFPKNGAKVPELRFAGFADDWEVRKLNEVSDIYDGTHQTPKYQDNGVMFLSVENIKTLTSNKFISREAFEDEFKIRPQRGDVLMTRIGDIGTANVVETDEDLAYYVSLALFKSEELNPYFLQASIYAPFVQDQIWKRTLHIAFPKKINKNEIGQVPINVPTLAEQTKIGSFFKQLDKTIALHQRKIDLLKEQKKGFLQKMFV